MSTVWTYFHHQIIMNQYSVLHPLSFNNILNLKKMFFNEFLENCLNRFLFHLLDIYLKFLVNFVLFSYSVTEFYLECCFYLITCRTCYILKTISTSESKLDFDMKIVLKRKKNSTKWY